MPTSARIKQAAKILVSGILFSFLGIGGLLFSLLIVPLLKLAPGNQRAHQRRGRWLIHMSFRAFVWALEASGILKLEVEGLPAPPDLKGKLILANHPGYLDIVLILSVLGETACVVKEPVYNNFFFGGLVREAGHVPNLDPEGVISSGVEALAQGNSLIIFPEGTRSSSAHPLQFHRGAAHIALGSHAPIILLVVTCDPPLLGKGTKWYDIPHRTSRYQLCLKPAQTFDIPGIGQLSRSQAARLLTKELEFHFGRVVNESKPLAS